MYDCVEVLEYEVRFLPVFFPKGMVCCDLCPALETYARYQCRRSGEYLIKAGKNGFTTGAICPLLTLEEIIKMREGENVNT